MMLRTRIDKLLVEKGLCRSRNQAQSLIKEGVVQLKEGPDWLTVEKPNLQVIASSELRCLEHDLLNFVSRGAIKLLRAIEHCAIPVKGNRCLDVGQSTGGFTQILLELGASAVTGIEVGHDQLAPELRANPNVHTFEGVNARTLTSFFQVDGVKEVPENFLPPFELAVMDVSFISQTHIISELSALIAENGHLLSLVKPQFELDASAMGKGGIVRNPELYQNVETRIREACASARLKVLKYFPSAITGSDGNHEFFVYARKQS